MLDGRRLEPERRCDQHHRDARERHEDACAPDERRDRTDHRPEERSEDGCAHRAADQLRRDAARGAAASSHENAPAHVNALPTPWTKRAANSVPKLPGDREAEAREPHPDEPDDHRAPRTEPGGRGAARQARRSAHLRDRRRRGRRR